jgi:hypothetical protein
VRIYQHCKPVTPGPAELPHRIRCLPSASEANCYQATALKCLQSIRQVPTIVAMTRTLLFHTRRLTPYGTAVFRFGRVHSWLLGMFAPSVVLYNNVLMTGTRYFKRILKQDVLLLCCKCQRGCEMFFQGKVVVKCCRSQQTQWFCQMQHHPKCSS